VRRSGGFTLLEALVALALELAFASVLVPYLFQARRIVAGAENRVAAHVLLRTLLDAPFDRVGLANAVREGEVDGLRWRVVTERMPTGAEGARWSTFRVVASVAWERGLMVSAETVRLGQPE
jgi:type II secretory pathway component PulJ